MPIAMARQAQMLRDQDRLKIMSGVVNSATSGQPPLPENAVMRPPQQAIDILRNDPDRTMPFFIKHFGIENVPPDLHNRIQPGMMPKKRASAQ